MCTMYIQDGDKHSDEMNVRQSKSDRYIEKYIELYNYTKNYEYIQLIANNCLVASVRVYRYAHTYCTNMN